MARRRKSEYRLSVEFAVVLAVAGAALAAGALWKQHGTKAALYAGAGLAVLALAVFARSAWLPVFRAWMRLAEGLGFVMTRVLLSIFYYLILTPVGFMRRVLGHPTLDTTWRDGKSSYWIDKDPVEASLNRYEKRY